MPHLSTPSRPAAPLEKDGWAAEIICCEPAPPDVPSAAAEVLLHTAAAIASSLGTSFAASRRGSFRRSAFTQQASLSRPAKRTPQVQCASRHRVMTALPAPRRHLTAPQPLVHVCQPGRRRPPAKMPSEPLLCRPGAKWNPAEPLCHLLPLQFDSK